ncbi:hypothetical protein PHMEG_0003645 [Phytophthora megakarya]|uniref:Uncharacterized protein n=1 Tax=Phytophthora megakarya TaxID=4795 RepID=A0A225WVV1_9STRA|nr:hypothetical protein PHMEG_0003645 [Phytophthora megakarya]
MESKCLAVRSRNFQHGQKREAQQSRQHPPGIWKRSRVSARAFQIQMNRITCTVPPVSSTRVKSVASAHQYGAIPKRAEICACVTHGQNVIMQQFGTQCLKQPQHKVVSQLPTLMFPSPFSRGFGSSRFAGGVDGVSTWMA